MNTEKNKKFSMVDFKPGYKSWLFSILFLGSGGALTTHLLGWWNAKPVNIELMTHGVQINNTKKEKLYELTVFNSGNDEAFVSIIKINGKEHKEFYSANTTSLESLRNFQFEYGLGGLCPATKYCTFSIPYSELSEPLKIKNINIYSNNQWFKQKI